MPENRISHPYRATLFHSYKVTANDYTDSFIHDALIM